MKKILFLILLGFTLASAEINEYLSDVYFANGIDTTYKQAKDAREDLNISTMIAYPQSYKYISKWGISYNHTHGIGIDLYESMLQKIDEHWYTESLLEVSGLLDYSWKGLLKMVAKKVAKVKIKEQAEKYAVQIAEKLIAKHGYVYGGVHLTKDEIAAIFAAGFEYAVEQATDAFLDIPEDIIREQEAGDIKAQFGAYTQSIEDGHGVVVIAHSQGNLFTNLAYDMFENHWIPWEEDTEWMRPYFTAIAVASPATDILGNSQPSITFENDIIQVVPDSMPALEPNPTKYYYTNALGEKIEVKYSMEAHAFLTSYMATDTTRSKILGFINEKIVEQRDNFSTRPSQWEPKNIGCICKDKYAKMIHKFNPEGMNQYLSNEKVKDFAEDGEGKIYKANTGDHAEYVRALDGDRNDDGVFTIEEVDRDNICYTLKDDASNEIGRIEGRTEPIPAPKSGVVQVTLTWDNPAIDFDLDVGWNAGEHDIQDTGCPMEHFYVTSQYDIYPGTYPITVTHKQLDENESTLIPEKMQMIIQVPGKTEVYDIDINTVEELEVGHVADIFVKYINNEIAPDISPDPVLTPVISIPTSGGSGGGGYVGGSGSSGGSSGGTPWVPIDNPSCDQSCGCIPCEYKIIPYLEQLLYGPISGADIALYEARDYQNKTPLYVGKTSGGDTLYTAGNIEIPDSIVESLQDDILYLLVARGGHDIDHDDDFKIDDIPTLNQGETHLVLSGKDIKEIGFKMNVLTEIAYQITKNIIDVNTTQEVQNKLNEVAQRLLKDKIYGDTTGGINYKDLSFWMPTIHKPLLVKEYSEHFSPLVDNLFANRDVYQEAYAIVYDHVSAVPTLQSIRLDINEDINSSIVIGKVPVLNNGASEITSFTLEGDGSENFDIDTNGEVSISENAHLDYESKTYYQLYVSAVNDDGVSQKVLLLIQLHNVADAPEYQSFTAFTFYENSAIGTEAMRVLYDSGNSPLQSVQLTGKDSAYFRADIEGNTISVKVNQTLLSYITKRAYELQLQVSNLTETSQSLPIILQVSDRRDIPKLNDTRLYVNENAIAGTVIGKVNVVSDGYSPITHFIIQKPYSYNIWPDGYFVIDANGTIRVGENAALDYEGRSSYSAYIKAVNAMGESQLKYISVNLNNMPDVRPSFWDIAPLKLRVNKEAQPGTVLGNLNFSRGDNQVTMIKLNPLSPFEAVLYNGDSANIKTKDSLRDMQVYEYYLTAVVSNSVGDSNEKPIHITVNRESYEFSALEGTYNTVIGKIDFGTESVRSVALPNDNTNPIRNYFTLDNNGVLSTKAYEKWTEVLNYSKRKQMSFTAKVAYQNGETKDIGITVNVLSRTIATLDTPGAAKKIILNKEENRAYIADHDYGLHIVDITDIYNPKMISSLDTDGAANDLVLSADQQYIYLLDVGKGLKIVNISDEANPYVAAKVPLASYSYNIALSSDGNRAFVSHGSYGVEVIDLTDPISPQIITTIGFLGTIENGGANYHYEDVQPGGYTYVVVDGDRLYSVDWNYGLQVIDISDLENPVSVYAESFGQQGHSATEVHLHQEQKLISVISTNDMPMSLYSIKQSGKVEKIKLDSSYDEIEVFDHDIAYRADYAMFGFDAYNPTVMTRHLYLDIGQSYGMILDKERNIAYLANGKNGLRVINLAGIEQPVHHEPVLAGTDFNIPEQNLSSITVDDVLGSVTVLKTGDTPILQMWTAQSTYTSGGLDCGYTYYALPIDKRCEYDYSFFDVDETGNIHINDIGSLAYENIGNMAPFSVYAENENGHQSNQAKITVAIKEDADWTLKFQKSIIKIDANLSIGASIGNVMLKKSQREIFWIKIYDHDEDYCYGPGMIGANGWGIDLIDDPYNRYGNLNHYCHENSYFEITKEGEIHIKETPLPGHYVLHIVAEDRFGLRWLEKQEIEVLAP